MTSPPSAARAWHGLDWRFLLALPRLERVWLAPECAAEADALTAAGISIATRPDASDVAFLHSRGLDLPRIEDQLPPNALVRLVVSPGGSPLLSPGWLRPLHAHSKRLSARGWRVMTCAWAVPNLHQPKSLIDVNDREAMRQALPVAYLPARSRVTLKARAGTLLIRLGGSPVLCREGFIVARAPA